MFSPKEEKKNVMFSPKSETKNLLSKSDRNFTSYAARILSPKNVIKSSTQGTIKYEWSSTEGKEAAPKKVLSKPVGCQCSPIVTESRHICERTTDHDNCEKCIIF